MLTRSTNDGATFGSPINLSHNPGQSLLASVATAGNNVYVVWFDDSTGSYQLMFTKSNNNGVTFSTPIRISTSTPAVSDFPSIAASGNNVYIVWDDNGAGHRLSEVIFSKSTNSGNTFSAPVNLSNTPDNSVSASVATVTDSANVYVIWSDASKGNYEILFVRSNDTGNTFSSPMQLSNTTGDSVFSSISASTSTSDGKKRIFVDWQDVTPQNGGILFRKSDDGGTTFGNTVTLDGSWNRAGSPAVASSINSPNVHVAWNDGTSGNNEIIFSTSTNNGDSFGSTINLSDNPNDSVLPSVAVSNNYVYVAWTDDRTGTSDIFLHRENNMQLDIKLILKLRGF